MKLFILLVAVAVARAAPQIPRNNHPLSNNIGRPEVRLISRKQEQDPDGNYEYFYELDNGQKVLEAGRVQRGTERETGSLEAQGYFEYVGDNGITYRVDYIANEGGFQARGAHLPQAPAQIPEYAQLRREHPELFWAESIQPQFVQPVGKFVSQNDFSQSQLFDQPQPEQQFRQQDFNQLQKFIVEDLNQPQQFSQQNFDQPQQFSQQSFDQPQQFSQQSFDQPQQFTQENFDQPQQFSQQNFDQPQQFSASPQGFSQQSSRDEANSPQFIDAQLVEKQKFVDSGVPVIIL